MNDGGLILWIRIRSIDWHGSWSIRRELRGTDYKEEEEKKGN